MTVSILTGDCRTILPTLPAESVHCCVTSPPYWGLRDFGVAGQIGLEPSLDAYMAEMVAVFHEVRRVLQRDGTLWLNMGDSYAASRNGRSADMTKTLRLDDRTFRDKPFSTIGPVAGSYLKAKDLCMMPARLAIALQADGWWLRSDIIWHKPNPMPESITDRPTSAHEHVFLLAKSERYYFDADAVREPRTQREDANGFRGSCYVGGDIRNAEMGKRRTPGNKTHKGTAAYYAGDLHHRTKAGLIAYNERERVADPNDVGVRNIRNVWTIAAQPYSEAHFATFPPALIEPCIKAGCPVGGTVLDPFLGAGTTGLVADRMGRSCIGIELNPDYARMARHRVEADAGMFASVEAAE